MNDWVNCNAVNGVVAADWLTWQSTLTGVPLSCSPTSPMRTATWRMLWRRRETWRMLRSVTTRHWGSAPHTPTHLITLLTSNVSRDSLRRPSASTARHWRYVLTCLNSLILDQLVGFTELFMYWVFLHCFDTVGWVIWPVKTRPRYDL